jgi:hypothetical protein
MANHAQFQALEANGREWAGKTTCHTGFVAQKCPLEYRGLVPEGDLL